MVTSPSTPGTSETAGTGTGPTPTHIFAESGTYRVKLTVTDNRGKTDVAFRDVSAEGVSVESQVQHVASAVGVGNTATPSVVIPAAASPGDRLLLVMSLNSTDRTFTGPSGVSGTTLLGTNVAKTMSTTVWAKTLETGDPGATVTVPLTGGLTKQTPRRPSTPGSRRPRVWPSRTMWGWSTTRSGSPPSRDIPDGSWVVSYWADKSSTTTAWTPSGLVATRATGCGTSSARICSALADSAAKVPAVYGSIAATVDAPSSAATMWSIVLPTAPPAQPASGRGLRVDVR